MLAILVLPVTDTANFTFLIAKHDGQVLLWQIIPVVMTGLFGWRTKNLPLTIFFSLVIYLQLLLTLGNRPETTNLIGPCFSLVGAALAVGIAFCILPKYRWRSITGFYLLLCGLALLLGASYSLLSSGSAL